MFRLALALGRTVGELEPLVGAQELREWRQFEALEGPIVLHERLDWSAALISSTVANFSGNTKRPLAPRDFLARWSRPTPNELAAKLMGMVDSVGGRVREDRGDG